MFWSQGPAFAHNATHVVAWGANRDYSYCIAFFSTGQWQLFLLDCQNYRKNVDLIQDIFKSNPPDWRQVSSFQVSQVSSFVLLL